MRDFRHAKAMASTLREALDLRGLHLTHSEALELIAKLFGQPNWNTLSAAIERKATERPSLGTGSEPGFPDVMRPFWARHLTESELRAPGDRVKARWQALFDEANRLFASSVDPNGSEAVDLARRWLALAAETGAGDDETSSKYWAAYRDALADPLVAPKLPVNGDVLAHLGPAFARARSELVREGIWRQGERA